MTSPIGTPDDQAYTNAAGGALILGVYSAPPGPSTAFSGPVGSYNGLLIYGFPVTSGVVITPTFYADSGFTQFTGQWSAKLGSIATTQLIGPVLGNYVKIVVENPGGSTVNVEFDATPVNVAVPALAYLTDQNYLSKGVTSVGVSSSVEYFLPFVQPGPAWLWFEPQDNAGKLNIVLGVDSGFTAWGGVGWRQTGPVAAVSEYLTLPDLPVTVTITNTDAASAHSFRLALVPGGGTLG